MAYYKKYRCAFTNTDNQPCELSIWQEFASQPAIIDVTCSLDTIELINEEINISDSFISSQRLDFELISDYNWKYHDLYSVNMFYSRVELRVNNSLIYIGWVDSESYEEPFDYDKNYPVLIKSGNLKLLKRLDFSVSSIRTVREVITSCIQRVLPSANIAVSVDTYAWKGGMKYSIDKLQINPYVFFSDNDFKLPKCWEVLEEVCKAFQLRIIVSGNNVYVRDLVTWKGDATQYIELLNGSDLSFDETFNKIHITLDLSTEKPIKDYKIDDSLLSGISGQRVSMYQGAASEPSLADTAFYYREKQISSDTEIEGMTIKGNSNTYLAKINSYYEGDNAVLIRNKYVERISSGNRVIAQFNPIPLFLSNTDNWYLNIKLDTMLSVLTDPFGNANRAADGGNWWRNHENDYLFDATLVYVPLNVYLKDENGNILYYLDNTNNPSDDHWNKGVWRSGYPPKGAYRLSYYSSNFQNHTAFSDGKYQTKASGDKCAETNKAWASNSQYMTYRLAEHKGKPKLIEDMIGKGSIITLPPVNGILHIELLSGIDAVCYNDHVTKYNGQIILKYEDIRWIAYKDLAVSITDSNGKEYYSDDQLEYEVSLNGDAEKELSYDTKIGCVIDGDKSAKAGVMIDGEFVTDFTYKMDLSGDHLWYLEEHIMRMLEPILLKKRYALNVTSKRIDMTYAVNAIIKGDAKQMIPTQMTYYPERNKCKTKLIEL